MLALAVALPTGSSAPLAAPSARVVVVKSGLMRGGAGSDYAEYGLVLRNRSLTNDAVNVAVTVEALDAQGRSFTRDGTTITLIPAGTSFAVAGQLIWNVSIDISRIRAVVHVGRTLPRGRRLPPVRAITVTNYGQDVTASLTNPYKKPLLGNATIYGVFLDSNGRIIASASQTTDAVVQPKQTVPFDLFGNPSTTSQAAAVVSAFVSVDPCGLDAFTSACPVPGASK